ncbi:hypothetical protein PAHAL_J027800 [Panicum hallii]|uniref:Zinc finger GRF-type domain-containing protein n=1 Tax=Panicum hallii TaxID=206008 RepID=A0A2T7A9W5_9POAL|nr:hypothetical protein PAHAL_J027800 [Panicum hallii]
MSKWGSSTTQSRGSGASRMVERHLEPSSMWELQPYPLGKETGLPLIPCPDCGMARVIERRSGKDTTENYLRVFFKCPRNSFPKLCGFYNFQRQYLDKLEELGIVAIHKFPLAVDIGDEAEEVADASSGRMVMNMRAGELQIEAKVDNLACKFNLLMSVLVVGLGCVLMYVAGRQ